MPLRSPPPGFTDLRHALPSATFEIGYSTADNFTGAPLPGYGAPGCWLVDAAAEALFAAAETLADRGFGLVLYDGYRPARASRAMADWAHRTGNEWILDGFVAVRSRHNTGVAVDLALARDGVPLDHGTGWDAFVPQSAPFAADGQVLATRLVLREAMESAGFVGYSKEWWHFQLPRDFPRRDVPYGDDEDAAERAE
jgi:D-alanyl-D-alanine dipeptidase